jgi:MFS transporter, PPP family, 3-phenylpropionic acid transporter
MESLTLSYLGGLSRYYGQIRLWGSIGFVVSVSALGLVFTSISISYFPLILSCFLGLMLASVYAVQNRTHIVQKSQATGFYITIQRSGCVGLFVAIFLVQISQGAYIGFFSLYLKENDIGMGITGNLWAVAVIAEVVMFLFVYKLIAKFGAGTLLIFSLIVTVMRWAAIALFVQLLPILFIAQLGHAFTYSATHSAVLELIRQQFDDNNQHRGIIIYCSLCLGGGTALGAVISGFVWEYSASNTFIFSAMIAAVSVLIAGVWLKKRSIAGNTLLSE